VKIISLNTAEAKPVKRRLGSPPKPELKRMPCGCLALPVELIHKLGENFKSFYCDQHGEQKVTKKWLEEHKGMFEINHVPSEFGYQVILDNPTLTAGKNTFNYIAE